MQVLDLASLNLDPEPTAIILNTISGSTDPCIEVGSTVNFRLLSFLVEQNRINILKPETCTSPA